MTTAKKPKKQKLRNAEYYNLQETFDTLFADSKDGKRFTKLMPIILSEQNICLVSLKRKEYDERTISMLFRLIDNNMILVLEYENESRVAIYHGKLIQTEWKPTESFSYALQGLDLDSVWNNLIIQIGNIKMDEGNSIDEQLAVDEKRTKVLKEIERLEALARKEKQPKKKFELVQKITALKNEV